MVVLPVDKLLLLGPDAVARAAARYARAPDERWLLRQPHAVRASYVRTVLGPAPEPRAEEIWMLSQADAVRHSYIDEVLSSPEPPADPDGADPDP
jgi:hypothetical protein